MPRPESVIGQVPQDLKLVRFRLAPSALTLRGAMALVPFGAGALLLSTLCAMVLGELLKGYSELGGVPTGYFVAAVWLFSFGGELYLTFGALQMRVEVGIDGVRVVRLTTRAYHHLADVREVHVEREQPIIGWDVVRIALNDGRAVHLVLRPGPRRGQAIKEAITERQAAKAAEWPVALAQLRCAPEASAQPLVAGRCASAYRSKSVSRQTWWQLLEAPGVEPEMRVAAAIGLGPDVFRSERRRVRRLLKRLALPRLRTLLRRAFKSRTPDEAAAVLEHASRL